MKQSNNNIQNRFREHVAIKGRREDRGRITQDQLVEETGISKQTISSYLNNTAKRYEIRVVAVLCEYLGISPSEFFTWQNEGADEPKDVKALLPRTA